MAVEKEGNKSNCKVKELNYLPQELFNVDAFVFAERPQKCIYSFVGTLSVVRQ